MFSSSSNSTVIDHVFGYVSNYKATLLNSGSWTNYNYFNRLSAGSSTQVQCSTLSKVNAGLVYGRFGTQTYTGNPAIVGEYYTYTGCQGVTLELQ
jgi:hypothetical protein